MTTLALLAAVISCNDPSVHLRQEPLGFKCLSYWGVVFEKVDGGTLGESWRGNDGVIWGDVIGQYDFQDAFKACEAIGAKLPDLAVYQHGYHSGMDGVLPHMGNAQGYGVSFWTSTSVPGQHVGDPVTPIAMVEDGLYAYAELNTLYDVRCVK